ncbi:MAG: MATE family efflux transporter [Sphaerochaetaceae bacterium]|nr:MATE family efflux transporter [Sphaerochaetaceae bacterium]
MDLTEGKVGRQIILFSLPLMLGNMFQQIYSITDSIIVGNLLGSEALAAVGATMPVVKLSISLFTGITLGLSVVISQSFGTHNNEEVIKAIDSGYCFFMLFSVILSIFGFVMTPTFLRWIRVPATIMGDAIKYLRVTFLATLFLVGYNVSNSIYRGIGNSTMPLIILVISTLLNILLDYVFIRFIGLGVEGTAWATLTAQGISFLVSYAVFQIKYPHFRTDIRHLKFDSQSLKKSLKIGMPSGLKATFYWGGYTIITSTVNVFGQATIAAFGVASKIDGFVQTPISSLGNGLASFVGQNLGAVKPERVRKAIRASVWFGVFVSVLLTIILFTFARPIIMLFTNDEEVIALGIEYLRIVSLFYVIYSLQEVIQGLSVGTGNTLLLMISTITAMWVVRIPAAKILSHYLGAKGVWMSIPTGWFVAMFFTNSYFVTGKWRKKFDERKAQMEAAKQNI